MSLLRVTCCCNPDDNTGSGCVPPTLGVCCFAGWVTVPALPCNGLCVGYDAFGTYLGEIDGVTDEYCTQLIGSFDIYVVNWTKDPNCSETPTTEWKCQSYANWDHCMCDAQGGYFISGATDTKVCEEGWCCLRYGSHPYQTATCAGPMPSCDCDDIAIRNGAVSHIFSYDVSACVGCVSDPPPPPEKYLLVYVTTDGQYNDPFGCCRYDSFWCYATTGFWSNKELSSERAVLQIDPYHDNWITRIAELQNDVANKNISERNAWNNAGGIGILTIRTLHTIKYQPDPSGNNLGYPTVRGNWTEQITQTGRWFDPFTGITIPCNGCCDSNAFSNNLCNNGSPCTRSGSWCVGVGCTPFTNPFTKQDPHIIEEITLSENTEKSRIKSLPIKQIVKYIGAEMNQIINGETEKSVAEKRLAECMKCPHRQVTYKNVTDPNGIGFCDACGCGSNARAQLGVKVTISGATCPLNKWDKSEGVGFTLNTALQSAQGLVQTATEMFKNRTNKNGS